MEATGWIQAPESGTARLPVQRPRSAPLLRLSSDERLVARIRAGNEAAFETLFERYRGPLLSFCRHMLGSQEDAEDAVQLAFTNAYRDILRSDRALHVRPWLYRIARNQCITTLRNRRPQAPLADDEPSLVGLSEEVAGRDDLRRMLRDLAALPADQREALLLAELHDNSHAAVAQILGCDREKVKSLVFQARKSMITSRRAREISCEEIQRQLSVLRGGSLRRSLVRRHLQECPACTTFKAEVARQRAGLAVVLPVVPMGVLKAGAGTAVTALAKSAASAGGAAGASAGAGAGTTAASAGTTAALATKLGVPVALVKGAAATIAVTTVAATGAAGVKVAQDVTRDQPLPVAAQEASQPGSVAPGEAAAAPAPARERAVRGRRVRSHAGTRSGRRLQGGVRSRESGARGRRPEGLRPARHGRRPDAIARRPERPAKSPSRSARARDRAASKRKRPERRVVPQRRKPGAIPLEEPTPLPDSSLP
jgi:RNA polymerase sigma factor (sigma-70 family)